MSRSSETIYGVYTHPNDDSQAHAKWVLSLMGPQQAENPPQRYQYRSKPQKPVCYMNPFLWRINCDIGGKFVPKKGNDTVMIWVSCYPECPKCGGVSPGCGREQCRIVHNNDVTKFSGSVLYNKLWDKWRYYESSGMEQPFWLYIENED